MSTATFDEIVERANARIDHDHIRAAARWTAEQLEAVDVAIVRLEPGDFTRYTLLIVCNGVKTYTSGEIDYSREYWVSLTSLGHTYEWTGDQVHPSYVHEKWLGFDHYSPHTAAVLTTYLNALAERFAERTDD